MSLPKKRLGMLNRYPIAWFIILATGLGGGAVYLVVQGVIPSSLALASAVSASLAGIIMSAAEDGIAGLKQMLSRLLIWRAKIGYWLFAALFIAGAAFLGSLANPLFGGDPINLDRMGPAYLILPMFLAFLIVAGLGQELGWTGFLLPRLQARYGALASGVIRAILVALWHLPLLLYSRLQPPALADFPYAGWIAQVGFIVSLGIMLVVFLIPWSIFFTWLFNNSGGSLLLVAVLHGSEVWVAYWMLNAGIDSSNLNNYWGYGAILVTAALIIILANGGAELSRKSNRIVHRPSPGQQERKAAATNAPPQI